MGRKSKKQFQEIQLLNKSEILEYVSDLSEDSSNLDDTFILNMYQFTKLIFDNIK